MYSRSQWLRPLAILFFATYIPAQVSPPAGDLPRFVRVEPEALEASALQRKHPVLPPLPADLTISTTAVLEVIVDERGIVRSASPVSVHPRFQDEAVRAARQWTFSLPPDAKPAMRIGRITFKFAPSGPGPEPVEIGNARIAAEGDLKNPSVHYALAKLYFSAGRYEEGIEALTQSLALKPDFEEACVLLGEIYGRLQRRDDQISTYTRYLQLKAESTVVLDLLARAYIDGKRYQDAIGILKELQALKPADLSVLLQMGKASALLDRIEDAIRIYRKAVEIGPDSATAHSSLGYELCRIRQFKDGEAELNRALTLDPSLRAAYHSLGDLYAQTDRPDKGLEMYRTCVSRAHPDFQDLEEDYRRLGEISIQLKKLDQAADILEQALQIKPDSSVLYCDLGRIQGMLGHNQQAVEILRKGIQTAQKVPCLYGILGNSLMDLNRLDEAEDALNQLIKLTPNVFFGYLQLAEVLSRQERWEEARSNLDEALELAPNDFRIHMELAQLYSRTAKPAEAESEMRTALRLHPTDPMVLNNFGYFLLEQGKDLAEAFKMIERAVAADPDNAAYLDSLGWAHFKLDNLELAEKYIVESLKQRGSSPEVLEHLGDVYMKLGKEDLARQKWREALAVFLNRVQAERLKQKLGATVN